MRTFSKREALSYGWQRFKERPLFLIGLFIITTVISAISGFVADSIQTGGISVVVGLMDFAIQMLLGMGMTLILLRVYDQVDTDYTDLLEPLHLFWKYLAMTVLVLVVVIVGFLLLIIPGIIAGIALSFAAYLVIDRNLGPIEAMKESLRITHGHRWNLFMFGLAVFFLNILGAMFFGIGLLVTVPISALATVHVYRWLLNPEQAEQQGVEVSSLAKVLSVVLFTAMLAVAAFFVFSTVTGVVGNSPAARDAQRQTDLVDIKLANALYYDANGQFAASLQELVPDYIAAVPTDPTTKDAYTYTVYADGIDYEVCATSETSEENPIYCEYGLDLGTGTVDTL